MLFNFDGRQIQLARAVDCAQAVDAARRRRQIGVWVERAYSARLVIRSKVVLWWQDWLPLSLLHLIMMATLLPTLTLPTRHATEWHNLSANDES